MAFKIGFATELLDPEKRDAFLDDLIDLLNEHKLKTTITTTLELVTIRGSRKIVNKVEIAPGEEVSLAELDIVPVTPLERAIEGLRPKAGSGISAVELSSGGKTVRLDRPL